ncbi:heat shock protein chaperone [Mesoplasma florum W37]|uniref:DnaJ-class molecular chaperone CbpA n=2 Tax=Mesoplasma florum TaxID=2151 RepID=A0AAD0HS37_MESFO|nr:heat shock protein chaperone [Mesoplasma florum W37]AVN65866.1 DnaJ-class molecular chaperone CbpA [Mesoplasma florum]
MRNTKRTVLVSKYDYYESFEEFPFNSEFNNTKEYLLKNNFSFTTTNDVIKELNEAQSKILNFWLVEQRKLLKAFDQTGLEDNYQNRNFLMKFYNESLNIYMKVVTQGFVPRILKAKIDFLKGDALLDIDKEVNLMHSWFTKAINDLINELYKQSGVYQQSETFNNQYQQYTYQQQKQSKMSDQFSDINWAYQTLGVNEKSTSDEIKKQYRKLAMTYHPDKNKTAEAKDKMVEINRAYQFLKSINKVN